MYIIHSVNKTHFEEEIKSGFYGKESLEKFGFIHCSEISTYALVAPNFKSDFDERLILLIDTDKVSAPIKWEDGGGVAFPHIYGLVRKSAIVKILPHLWSENREWIKNPELESIH